MNDRVSERMCDVQQRWANAGGPTASTLGAIALRPGLEVARAISDNLLLDVDGGASLRSVESAATTSGLIFPLVRPTASLSIAAACARLPIFVEGYVAHVDATDTAGRSITTPKSPRSAQGPDLIGALSTRPPLAVCVRARLRCASRTTTHVHFFETTSAAQSAAMVTALAREGRAFSVRAEERGVWVATASLSSTTELVRATPADALPPPSTRPIATGRMLSPFDQAAVQSALESGADVLAAPQMGRVGTLEEGGEDIALVSVQEAAAAVTTALRATREGNT